MKYYLHSSTSFSDEKISELFMNFGYEGLGLFYTLLEKLSLQEKPIKTEVLKSQLKVGKRLQKCWDFMEEIELISSKNGETFNENLLNFSEKYKIKKEKNAKRISEWREKQDFIKDVTHYESVRNTCKVKKSKVKENNISTNVDDICDDFAKVNFEIFRKAYPGKKSGFEFEYANFIKKNKPETVDLLLPALNLEINYRKQASDMKMFVPEWKNLQTWINKKCWTQEFPISFENNYTTQTERKINERYGDTKPIDYKNRFHHL